MSRHAAILRLHDRINRNRERGTVREFWSAVDSGIGYTSFGGCYCGKRVRGYCETCGTGWREVRKTSCLALRSDATRCGKDAVDGTPFCGFHLQRAEDWFLRRLSIQQQRYLEWELESAYNVTEDDLRVAASLISVARSGGSRVYFYELEGQGLVKIGTSTQVEQRVAQFRNGSGCTFPPDCDPSTGRLIGHISGDRIIEQALHAQFRPLRVAGEWFHLTDDLASAIAELLDDDQRRTA